METPFRCRATDPGIIKGIWKRRRNLTPEVRAALEAAAGGHGLRLVAGVKWGQRSTVC